MNANMNPFMNLDMTKMMADFDPTKLADNFAKLAGSYSLPDFNVDGLVQAQQKNIEALNAANKPAVEGIQAVAQRQTELVQELVKEATDAVAELSKLEAPEEAAAKQAELLKTAFEKAVANSTELAEMVATSNAQTSKLISARITESLDDIRKQAVTLKKKK